MNKEKINPILLNVTCQMKVAIYQPEKGNALENMEKRILPLIDNSKSESCNILSIQVDAITTNEKKEDFPPENMKDLYAELNKEARKANYIKYSPDKLVRGQFGKFTKGFGNPIEYVLLSDRFLNREDSFPAYFYLLSIQTISCGSFCRETGERGENCKVIEMEDIDEAKALERYNQFLSVWDCGQ